VGYSIWLSFEDRSAAQLHEAISALSSQFSTPVFPPHLTLVGDIELGLHEVEELTKLFAASPIPPEIFVRDVDISDEYFMALYLSVDIPYKLQQMRQHVAHAAHRGVYKLDDPHVSLLYGNPDGNALSPTRDSLRKYFCGQTLRLRGLNIVQSSKSMPVSDWKILSDYRF
jgi:2'-5' RNA ligase